MRARLTLERACSLGLIGWTASYDLSQANFSPAAFLPPDVIKVEGGRRSFVLAPLLSSLLFFLSEVCNQG